MTKVLVFQDVTLSLHDSYQHFRVRQCLHLRGQAAFYFGCLTLKMKALWSFKSYGTTQPTTQQHVQEVNLRITTVTTPNQRCCSHATFGHQIMGAPESGIHSFIPLACAECDDSLPFSWASSIPLRYVLFPATLLHQLFFHPPSPQLVIYFLVYLSILLFPNSYIIPFWEFYFLPFSVHAQTNIIYLTLLSLIVYFLIRIRYGCVKKKLWKTHETQMCQFGISKEKTGEYYKIKQMSNM